MLGEEAYIHSVYTLPAFRKQGLSERLMQHIIEELKKRNISYVFLRTSEQGKAIYERLGFTVQPKYMDSMLVSD